MSQKDLQIRLRDAIDAGVRQFAITSASDVRQAAAALGYPYAHVDVAKAASKLDLFDALALALQLPDWFGRNWDALADCLCDLSWKPAPGYVVVFEGHDAFRKAHPTDFDTVLEVFAEAADFWREEDVPFWTLLAEPRDGTRLLPDFPA